MLPNLRPPQELIEKWWGDSPYQFTNSDPHPSEHVADRFNEWVSNEVKGYLDKQQAKVDVLVDALTQASWRLSEYAAGHPHHNTDELVREINKVLHSKIKDYSNNTDCPLGAQGAIGINKGIPFYLLTGPKKVESYSVSKTVAIKPLYKVSVIPEHWEVRPASIIGYFSDEDLAKSEVKGNAFIDVVNSVEFNGNTYILANGGKPVDVDLKKARSDAKLKEETLASLTDEQKRVLGLSD